jgi:hypothetical protein
MTKDTSQPTTQRIYQQIREVLIQARSRALRAVNTEMVACYWQIGRLIVEEEQQGGRRAEYGKQLIRDLSQRLSKEFGKGFDRTNLQHMRAFYLGYSNCDALRRELSWTHYRLLLRLEKPEARAFYEAEAVNSRWSTRELEQQINSLLFERQALSRDKAGVFVNSSWNWGKDSLLWPASSASLWMGGIFMFRQERGSCPLYFTRGQ